MAVLGLGRSAAVLAGECCDSERAKLGGLKLRGEVIRA
jgi:hypothetical protein